MQKMLLLRPEVSGNFGPRTVLTRPDPAYTEVTYPSVGQVEYVFDGWLGDELLTSHPVFIVTEALSQDLVNHRLTGFRLEKTLIRKSDQFDRFHPETILPEFVRLVPLGVIKLRSKKCHYSWTGDDINQSLEGYLVVSERAYEVISRHSVMYCDTTELLPC